MSDILHDFPIQAPPDRVYAAVSTPAGLDQWWTLTSQGEAREGATFALRFGPGHDWSAQVTRCVPGQLFELTLLEASPDWQGTRVRFDLIRTEGAATQVRFQHAGWPDASEHFRISSYCWAMYLRHLKRAVEVGEVVPYGRRLEV